MRLLVSWVRDFVDVTASPEEIAETLALRGFEVASIETARRRRRGDRLRGHRQSSRLPERPRPRARDWRRRTTCRSACRRPIRTPSSRLAKVESGRIGPPRRSRSRTPDLCPRYAAAVADVTADDVAGLDDVAAAGGRRPADQPDSSTSPTTCCWSSATRCTPSTSTRSTADASASAARRPAKRSPRSTASNEARAGHAGDRRRNSAQAVAGVMGGAPSEVSDATTVVAFESAYFKPASVRRTSKRLGLKTEASSRFERGADSTPRSSRCSARSR